MDSIGLQLSSAGDDDYVPSFSSLPPPFDPNFFVDSSSLLFDPFSPIVPTSTTTTTTVTSTPTTTTQMKNPRKRPRASRRNPTTVLTTDTSNFRAMVQEFTGIPAPPFSSSPFTRARLEPYGSDVLLKPFAHKFQPTQLPDNYNPSYSNVHVLNFQSLLNQNNRTSNDQSQVIRGNMPNLVSSEGQMGISEEKKDGSENVIEQWICSSVKLGK